MVGIEYGRCDADEVSHSSKVLKLCRQTVIVLNFPEEFSICSSSDGNLAGLGGPTIHFLFFDSLNIFQKE